MEYRIFHIDASLRRRHNRSRVSFAQGPTPCHCSLLHRLNAKHIAFAVKVECDEAVLPDGEFIFEDFVSRGRYAPGFDHAVMNTAS